MNLTLATKIKKNSRLITKKIGREVVILDPIAGEVKIFNETAGFIWSLLKKETTPKEIVQEVFRVFAVSQKTAQKDVLFWLRKCLQKGLIVIQK